MNEMHFDNFDNVITAIDINSQTLLNILQSIGGIGTWVYYTETEHFRWSKPVYDIFEMPFSQTPTKNLFLEYVHPEDREHVQKNFQRACQGTLYNITYRIIRNKTYNKILWLREIGKMYTDNATGEKIIIGMVKDVTQETEKCLQAEQKSKELDLIKEYFTETTRNINLPEIIKIIKQYVLHMPNIAGASILVLDHESSGANFYATDQDESIDFSLDDERGSYYIGLDVIRYNTEIFMPVDHYPPTPLKSRLLQLGAASLISFPIVYNGSAFAALTLGINKPEGLQEKDKGFYRSICEYLSFQLKNAFLYQKLLKVVEERERAERFAQIEKMKIEYFSNITHELKTPLNIILSAAQLIKLKSTDGVTEKDVDKFMSYIEQNAYRLLRVVINMIDLNKIDNNFFVMNIRQNDIVETIRFITYSTAAYASQKEVDISFYSLLPSLMINFDMEYLDRIMLNLLSNAIKNTPRGGSITVVLEDNNDFVSISVRDTGIGIASEKLEVIFDRFRTTQVDFKKNCEGSGLGLSIVKHLVEKMNGTISVQSELGKGTTVLFSISKKLTAEKHSEKEEFSILSFDDDQRKTRIKIEMANTGI